MKKLYNLQDDRKTIDEMQRGMKSKDKLIGLKNTHGLFGSDKWWKAISKNKLQLLTLSGIITKHGQVIMMIFLSFKLQMKMVK